MRSFSRLIYVVVAIVAGSLAIRATAQEREPGSSSRMNRPGAVAPVRVSRASHDEPVSDNRPAADRTEPSLPLAPQSKQRGGGLNKPSAPSSSRAITTVFGSLGVVLGLFFLVMWFTRRVRPKGSQSLPKEAVEVLGRVPLAGRQNMHLVRVGGKLLLLSVTPTGAETLTEITDPEEVERLTTLCQMSQPSSISATFRQVLSQFEKEPAPSGFIGETPDDNPEETATTRSRRRPIRSVR